MNAVTPRVAAFVSSQVARNRLAKTPKHYFVSEQANGRKIAARLNLYSGRDLLDEQPRSSTKHTGSHASSKEVIFAIMAALIHLQASPNIVVARPFLRVPEGRVHRFALSERLCC
jgi:hypothetical protein